MPKLTIQGHGTFDVDAGKRLVLAIEDCGVDVSHRCGGYAGCTTCRVKFHRGEPGRITIAEADKLRAAGLEGEARLSCQCLMEGEMEVEVLMPVSRQTWNEPGPTPAPEITPEPEWIELD